MVLLFYTTYISVDHAYHKIVGAKVGNCCINLVLALKYMYLLSLQHSGSGDRALDWGSKGSLQDGDMSENLLTGTYRFNQTKITASGVTVHVDWDVKNQNK